MAPEIVAAVCDSLQELVLYQEKPFSIVLHGGEPLLLGPKRLRQLFFSLRQVLPTNYPISIQSNGILISPTILDLCSAFSVSLAVSLDGPKEIHDKWRVTHGAAGTFDHVMKGLASLQAHPNAAFLNAGLLAVIDPTSDPAKIYQFFKHLGSPSVDFLYRDGNYNQLPWGKSSFLSTEYGNWMVGLLETYLQDPEPLPIRILDDVLKVLLGGQVSKEGMGLTQFGIVIIDTDGMVMKNDTLKSSFNGADQFQVPINIKDGGFIEFINSFQFREYVKMQKKVCSVCRQCPVFTVCGGGMILHRWKNENGFDNPSIYCADQLLLIKSMRKKITQMIPEYA